MSSDALRAKMPTRSARISRSGHASRIPDCAIASATVAPSGKIRSTLNARSGSAQTTDTATCEVSRIHAFRLGAEVVHHAVGEFLEAQFEGESGQEIADLEV